jgi:hypothetical protein
MTTYSKDKAILQQKLELTQQELVETKESYEEHKIMTDRILKALDTNSDSQNAEKDWSVQKQMLL